MKEIESPSRLAAAVGISAVVTAGFGWTEVLAGWCAALILTWLLGPVEIPEGDRGWQQIGLAMGGILLATAAVTTAEAAFPQDGTFPVVSLGALLLFYRALVGTEWGNEGAANVMGMLVLVMILGIEAAGLGNVRWSNLRPIGFCWENAIVTAGIACLLLGTGRAGQSPCWGIGAGGLCVGMSLITRGILGPYLTESLKIPMYRAMENIRVFGVTQRMEALLSAAILMGSFAAMIYGGKIIRKSGVIPFCGKGKAWGSGAAAVGIFLLEWCYRSAEAWVQTWMKAVFWGIMVITALGIVISVKNAKKG